MAVPDYQQFMLPLLRRAAEGPAHISKLTDLVAGDLGLTPEDRLLRTPGGGKTLLADRAGWAKTYMKQAGLLQQPKRGLVEITDRGRALLDENPAAIDSDLLMRFQEFREFKQRTRVASTDATATSAAEGETRTSSPAPASVLQTPEENALSAAQEIEAALRSDLVARLKANEPAFFERVVLDVLKALGYGAGSGGLAERTGGPNDGGIDGVIDEDRLGLDRIYVQAKRYGDQPVGPSVIQGFIGALQMKGASKGVLITTSRFSANAISAARSIPSMRIVLIDGERLADLMIRHGVGVRTDRIIEIKKIDLDYFEPEEV